MIYTLCLLRFEYCAICVVSKNAACFSVINTGRSEACRFLLEQGAPVGVYDDGGTSALTLMVEKMPDVAKIALAQFEVVDKALRKKYFYLNYLECETWKKKSTLHRNPSKKSFAKTPLEVYIDVPIFSEALRISVRMRVAGKSLHLARKRENVK